VNRYSCDLSSALQLTQGVLDVAEVVNSGATSETGQARLLSRLGYLGLIRSQNAQTPARWPSCGLSSRMCDFVRL
jgi:hypothetical protein